MKEIGEEHQQKETKGRKPYIVDRPMLREDEFMKATGITRKVDELGRVVLPIELRRNLGIGIGDTLEIFTEKDTIVLRRYNAVDDLLAMASRLKERVTVEGCGDMKAVLMDKLTEVEKIIMSGTDKH